MRSTLTARRITFVAFLAWLLAVAIVLTTPGNNGFLLGVSNAAEGDVKIVDPDTLEEFTGNDPHVPCAFVISFSGFASEASVDWEIWTWDPTSPDGESIASDTQATDVNGDATSDEVDLADELEGYDSKTDHGFHVKLMGTVNGENFKSKTFYVGCEDPDNEGDPECSDGIDNDGDGDIDHPADDGCTGPNDDSEDTAECEDGIDNDNDGDIDYPDDSGCSSEDDDSEKSGGGGGSSRNECEDFRDNDDDGLEDYPDDPGCTDDNDDSELDDPSPTPTPVVTPTELPARPFRCAQAAKAFGLPLVAGTKGPDVMHGTARAEVFCAKAGNDWVTGGGGNDIIWLGRGNDYVYGGAGNDTIRGQRGNDSIESDNGSDLVTGGAGRDTVLGGSGPDVLFAQQANDYLNGGPANDHAYGGPGFDACLSGGGLDTIGGCES